MKADNKGKAVKLGMPFGTASARLRKTLLFQMAKELKRTACYRCGKEIENESEFSIEHKEAWFNAADPVERFFAVDNIAFSHTVCNVRAADRPNKKYADGPTQKREGFRRHYADPDKRDRFLRRKRDRYHNNISE